PQREAPLDPHDCDRGAPPGTKGWATLRALAVTIRTLRVDNVQLRGHLAHGSFDREAVIFWNVLQQSTEKRPTVGDDFGEERSPCTSGGNDQLPAIVRIGLTYRKALILQARDSPADLRPVNAARTADHASRRGAGRADESEHAPFGKR